MSDRHVSPLSAGLRCRCPRCGAGRLFNGYLTVAPRCNACEMDFSNVDSGDGPAVFIVLIVGAILVSIVFFVEFTYQPSYWVHGIIVAIFGVGLPLLLLRPFKATMIALQYKNRAAEGRLAE